MLRRVQSLFYNENNMVLEKKIVFKYNFKWENRRMKIATNCEINYTT